MVEDEVIIFKQSYLQKKIDSMRNYVEKYKKSVDECNPAGISSDANLIGELGEFLKNEKRYLNRKQEDEIDDLKREYAIKFQKLNLYNVCECKPKAKK